MDLTYATTNKHKLAGAKQALAGTDINLIAPMEFYLTCQKSNPTTKKPSLSTRR